MEKILLKYSLRGLMLMGLLTLGGCVSLLPDAGTPATKYTLQVPQNEIQTSANRQGSGQEILKISVPMCEQSLRTARILVLHEDVGITRSDFLADALWSENLPDLVQQRLIQYLNTRDLFKSVGQSDENIDADLLMIPTIDAFELHRTLDQKMYARVAMTFKIVKAQTHKLIKNKSFSKEILLTTLTQKESLAALQKAFVGVLEEVGEWARALTKEPRDLS